MINECNNFDKLICIGNNTFISPDVSWLMDPDVLAYFNFENSYGLDMSGNGKFNLKYDINLS